jgi:alpha-tubulin suppressor-like RCC1 family protein
MGDNLPAVDLGSGKTATAITAGYQFTCAVLSDNSVKCWGHNLLGELGLGDAENRGDGPGEMGDNLPAVLLP